VLAVNSAKAMNTKRIPTLSKSRYLAGLQCPLRLWYQCYRSELASDISPFQQAVFDTGHEVGRLARRLYPGGVPIETDPLRHDQAVGVTRRALEDPDVKAIYEAGFLENDVRVKADILGRVKGGKWNVIEVKSSTKVKPEHIPDVGIQYHVLKEAGLNINRVFLMHLNKQYVYDGGELDIQNLFLCSDLTEEALSYQAVIPLVLKELRNMLGRADPPDVFPSRTCSRPYACEFWEHCRKGMVEHPVWHLSGISQKKLDALTSLGIEDIRDIPDSFPLNQIQDRIRTCVKRNEAYASAELKKQMEKMKHPVHFLDFETLALAIPRYLGTSPYQSIPFQWSDHLLRKDGTVEHREYLCCEDKDPREQLTAALLDALGSKGSIVTYTNYEESVIKGLAEALPQHKKRLLATLARIKDLHKIVSKHYYHPAFRGSFSLKSVAPALLPDMSYENLAVDRSGHDTGREGKNQKALLAYCGRDTLVMVQLREKLLKSF
jgi:predicted RecB family nuclease